MQNLGNHSPERYARQTILPHIGEAGQQRLLSSRIAIVGLGGLGCPAALYLAAAGIGQLIFIDDDRVSLHNLQRQVLYEEGDVGRLKVEAARETVLERNSGCQIDIVTEPLTADNSDELLRGTDIILDGTDNHQARQIMHNYATQTHTPWVYAAIGGFSALMSLFDARQPDNPCYACLHPDSDNAPTNCAETGVPGPLPGIIGTMQAMQAINCLLGIGTALTGRLLRFDATQLRWCESRLQRDPACPHHAPLAKAASK